MDLKTIKDFGVKNITILDKYILRQVVEIFILGVIIFSSIIFASEAFTELIKKVSDFGIPPRIALMIILLNLPAVIVQSIPMSMLLATVMGLNKLCLALRALQELLPQKVQSDDEGLRFGLGARSIRSV